MKYMMGLVLATCLLACSAEPGEATTSEAEAIDDQTQGLFLKHHERRKPGGGFSCDFGIPASVPGEVLAPAIERDRMIMSAQPGLRRKHIPFGIDADTGDYLAGGRYLFDTFADAAAYHAWVQNDFALGGVPFLERPIFLAPECHHYAVLGHKDFSPDLAKDTVLRTERFSVAPRKAKRLKARFARLRRAARKQGYSRISLMLSPEENLVAIVYMMQSVLHEPPQGPDFESLVALASAPKMGDQLGDLGLTPVFDRTEWTLTTWYPFVAGDQGQPSDWPNSPPFPAPSCSDQVCEPSRGEDIVSCPVDCTPSCGDSHCDADETIDACPSDCRTW